VDPGSLSHRPAPPAPVHHVSHTASHSERDRPTGERQEGRGWEAEQGGGLTSRLMTLGGYACVLLSRWLARAEMPIAYEMVWRTLAQLTAKELLGAIEALDLGDVGPLAPVEDCREPRPERQ